MRRMAEWLEKLGMSEYAQRFVENRIDFSVLRDLTDQDLKDLGVVLGDRRKLLRAIGELDVSNVAARESAIKSTPHDTAERRQVTVMFSDLVGSTALSARMDPEDLREVISAYQTCVTETVRRFGGFVANYLGDGVLVYFGYPEAQEDDAERAVCAGLEQIAAVTALKAPVSLQTRLGIATGLVVVGDLIGSGSAQEQAVVGETPNLAARLQAVAEPNMVVIAEGTRRLLGTLFELEALGAKDLKGIAGPVQAWAALRPASVESRFDALHASGVTELVGREEEIEILLRRWSRAKSRQGQVVLLSGEGGIGKSRLTATLLERVAPEPHARLRYFCSPQRTNSAFFPIVSQMERAARFAHDDTLRTKLDKLDAVLAQSFTSREDVALFAEMLSLPNDGRYPVLEMTPQQRRQKTLEALFAQVETFARKSPVLMIFEDAHWADPTSLEAFGRVVDRIVTLRVLLLITFRPEFEPPWIGQPHVTALTINRLTRCEVDAMIDRVVGDKVLPADIRQDIIERTDGIPLFVEEMTKAVLEAETEGAAQRTVTAIPSHAVAVPATLHASLMARLDRLASARDLAQIGAAIGRQFSHELIGAVAAMPKEHLDEALGQLVNAQLIFRRGIPPDAEYTFKHALVQDAAYSTLLRSRRQQLHARIAAALEERFPELVMQQPELLAEHCAHAGWTEKAGQLWRRAGHNAARRAAHREASALFERALDALAALPPSTETLAESIDIRWDLHHSLYPLGELTRTRANLETAAHSAEQLGDDMRLSSILSSVVYTLGALGDLLGAVEAGERAHKLAERQSDPNVRLRTNMMLARTLYGRGTYERAAAHARQALDLISRSGGDGPRHEGYLRFGRVNGRIWLTLCLSELGRFDEATVVGQEATEIAQQVNGLEELIFAGLGVGRMLLLQGNLNKAVDALEPALALCTSADFPIYVSRIASSLGAVYALLGRIDEALVLLEESVRQALAINFMFGHSLVLSHFARACGLAGRQDDAIAYAHNSIDFARTSGERGNEGWAWRCLGDLVSEGSTDPSIPEHPENHYRTALVIADELGMRPLRVQCLHGLSRLYGNSGNFILKDKYATDAGLLCREMGVGAED
jgi:class 3 adenylate cyclase/tetratricopeptide (TPR) repeat protein